MGKTFEIKDTTLLFETFSEESRNLFETFINIGKDVNAVVMEDNGFLPEGVISPFSFFMGDYSQAENVPGKPLYFDKIPIPRYWEISGNGSSGVITNIKKECAKIYYAQNDNSRLVRVIDWLDEDGNVRISEHYNKYGAIFCRTLFNAKNQKTTRSFFSPEGEEKIYQNFVTDDYIVNWEGKDHIIHSRMEFMKFFFECSGLVNTNIIFNSLSHPFFVSLALPKTGNHDILFWNEPITNEIPGNMKVILSGNAGRANKIFVQRHSAYQRLIELGASSEIVKELGYVYSFERENMHRSEALIFTNSDNIEKLGELVNGAPNLHFNIAALTEMSNKLNAMEYYENVTLYPGIKQKIINVLFEKCDIYLDINHEAEVADAVHKAFMNNMLILGFDNTLHNRNYISPTNVIPSDRADVMIAALNAMADNAKLIDSAIKIQHEHALAASKDDYKKAGLI